MSDKILYFKHDERCKCADGSYITVEVEACYWPNHDDIAFDCHAMDEIESAVCYYNANYYIAKVKTLEAEIMEYKSETIIIDGCEYTIDRLIRNTAKIKTLEAEKEGNTYIKDMDTFELRSALLEIADRLVKGGTER